MKIKDDVITTDAALGREYTSEKVHAYIRQDTCGFSSHSKHQRKVSDGSRDEREKNWMMHWDMLQTRAFSRESKQW